MKLSQNIIVLLLLNAICVYVAIKYNYTRKIYYTLKHIRVSVRENGSIERMWRVEWENKCLILALQVQNGKRKQKKGHKNNTSPNLMGKILNISWPVTWLFYTFPPTTSLHNETIIHIISTC